RTVMQAVFERLTAWLAPLIPFTMEEAWTTRYPDAHSNCMRVIPDTPAGWFDGEANALWQDVLTVLPVVTGALELARRDKLIGSSLEAAPTVWIADPQLREAIARVGAAETFRTSDATVDLSEPPEHAFKLQTVPPVGVAVSKADGEKCHRCWRVLPEVKAPKFLCERCDDAVAAWDAARA
ncbi:zinc finger domain-containing protein, partial [Phenylobacterium sp.]|uniref:zinc finger domain-containing protein n=1 Tax=Phenylobacterium sp. TaxID=1871053 RepID=UPI0025F9F05D